MMSVRQRITMAFLLVLYSLSLGGCIFLGNGTQPTWYFLLSGMAAADPREGTTVAANGPLVCVEPVEIPSYLQRPQIVTLAGDNRIRLAQFHRWAEPLEDALHRVLVSNLTLLLPDMRVSVSPFLGKRDADYRIQVEVVNFIGRPGESVLLQTRWDILGGKNGSLLASRRGEYMVKVEGDGYEGVVAAMGKAVEDLSRDISRTLEGLDGP